LTAGDLCRDTLHAPRFTNIACRVPVTPVTGEATASYKPALIAAPQARMTKPARAWL
jgi:hypothetical protein